MGAQHRLGPRAAIAIAVLAGLVLASPARAVELTLGAATADAGETLALPLGLVTFPGENVAVLSVEVVVSPGVFSLTAAQPGPAAQEAGKNVAFSQVSEGRYRVLVTGFNLTVMNTGLLAQLQFQVQPGAHGGAYTMQLQNPIAGDIAGQSLHCTATGGTATVRALWHSADVTKDFSISIWELIRVVQFFNVGSYHCDGNTEDGYAPGPGNQSCFTHASDYLEPDWRISINELLRLVQLYNVNRYQPSESSEDGFTPAPGAT